VPLTITSTQQDSPAGPYTLVRLAGEADATTPELGDVLRAEVGRRPRLLVIELPGLWFMDSSALRVILRTHRELTRDGGVLALVSPSPAVARMFKLVSIGQLMPVCTSVEEAVALAATAD
jgi:anti-sigma B factor antagonist